MNIKKIFFCAVFLLVSFNLYAEQKGNLKAGISLGYPTGVTLGYRINPPLEMNFTLGTDYDSFVFGMNGLFSITKLNLSGETFPFSLGPAFYFDTHDHHDDYEHDHTHTHLDILCIARFEYDFRNIPLNLFIEAGLGIRMVEHLGAAGSFAIGARFVF